ncbi:hypothetical protein [Gimesia sp.]|uniref:hypothetical protein n=1 Tax=Gimesia sp. TaxID=2024833 RepID=UPI000C553909|nr:hypothetical protein [Gimesia sp.]MAX40315.1 hypothetical protein [Gimesia sp.]HBL42519.1 hypothetical protein [Planctomycetaceae bacterium]|tara:strand:+ start:12192 stop:12506 length:315 start_codon:yes stop_codon:yes gene_type:complete
MAPETIGLIGGVGGTVIGVLGGVVGTWCSIKNTNGPAEKAFMIRIATVMWIMIPLFLLLLFLLPQPWNQLIWIPYAVCLTWAIHFCNRKQQAIREAEASLKEML